MEPFVLGLVLGVVAYTAARAIRDVIRTRSFDQHTNQVLSITKKDRED